MSKKDKGPPFVMVTNQVLDAPAWRAMSLGARLLYIALKRRYWSNKKNNGRLYLSVRQAAKELGSGKTQISRWFRELQHYGFIVMMTPGCLGIDGKGKAPHWRLTEVAYMRGTSQSGHGGHAYDGLSPVEQNALQQPFGSNAKTTVSSYQENIPMSLTKEDFR